MIPITVKNIKDWHSYYVLYNPTYSHNNFTVVGVRSDQQRWCTDNNIKEYNYLCDKLPGRVMAFNTIKDAVAFNLIWSNGINTLDKIRDWMLENSISAPYSDEDIMAIMLRWE